jgi:hypothetical protein
VLCLNLAMICGDKKLNQEPAKISAKVERRQLRGPYGRERHRDRRVC